MRLSLNRVPAEHRGFRFTSLRPITRGRSDSAFGIVLYFWHIAFWPFDRS